MRGNAEYNPSWTLEAGRREFGRGGADRLNWRHSRRRTSRSAFAKILHPPPLERYRLVALSRRLPSADLCHPGVYRPHRHQAGRLSEDRYLF